MAKKSQNSIICIKISKMTLFQENEFFLVKFLGTKYLAISPPHQFSENLHHFS